VKGGAEGISKKKKRKKNSSFDLDQAKPRKRNSAASLITGKGPPGAGTVALNAGEDWRDGFI